MEARIEQPVERQYRAMNFKLITLPRRLMLLTGILTLVTCVGAQVFFAKKERADLDLRLREKAQFLNNFYAFLISDAIQRNDDVTLQQVINRLEEDPEITQVVVVDQKGDIRYHPDPQKVAAPSDDALILKTLESADGTLTPFRNSGGEALALICPLKVAGSVKPLGAVRIELTYRHIEQQVARSAVNFVPFLIGFLLLTVSLMRMMVGKWILLPLNALQTQITRLSAGLLDANVTESPDEFGAIAIAINDFILRVKEQTQNSQTNVQERLEQERALFQNVVHTLVPEARVILADKDNLIVSDSADTTGRSAVSRHLLDLISETNFANLVKSAFQSEGQVIRGSVLFEEKTYEAAVLSIPTHQTQQIKTLIALKPSDSKEVS